jgi:hypothetical protein
MPSTATLIRDPWLPRQLPTQLAALGALYRAALASGSRHEAAGIGWRLYAALAFATRLAPRGHLADLTGLTVEQVDAVLVEFADEDTVLTAA